MAISTEFSYLDLAATDQDLVAYHELKIRGYTSRDRETRDNLLADYDRTTLLAEIAREYLISNEDVIVAEAICITGIYLKLNEHIRGQA
jgi:hypothetical protein